MSAGTLLSRLDRVKSTGPGRWIARCPAHDDRGPSLSVRELDDGRVLVHDFAGCSVSEVLAAVGLDMSDLFPPRLEAPRPGKPHRERRPFHADDLLRVLAFETQLVALAAAQLLAGKTPTQADLDRLQLAADRLNEATHYVHR